mmetsp:Transcript_5906/g.12110  ORF Transcript_5906/g.12110 Transcript_5906/m.12110 type:complete len:270 (-) Transcript_5906:247-1056(-)
MGMHLVVFNLHLLLGTTPRHRSQLKVQDESHFHLEAPRFHRSLRRLQRPRSPSEAPQCPITLHQSLSPSEMRLQQLQQKPTSPPKMQTMQHFHSVVRPYNHSLQMALLHNLSRLDPISHQHRMHPRRTQYSPLDLRKQLHLPPLRRRRIHHSHLGSLSHPVRLPPRPLPLSVLVVQLLPRQQRRRQHQVQDSCLGLVATLWLQLLLLAPPPLVSAPVLQRRDLLQPHRRSKDLGAMRHTLLRLLPRHLDLGPQPHRQLQRHLLVVEASE